MAITQGIQSPNLQFRDSTTNKSISVNELRDAADQVGGFQTQINQNTADIADGLKSREVKPFNDDYNGYLDPEHTTTIQYEDTSDGTRAFSSNTEIAPNLFVSDTGNVTFSSTGISWLPGNSLYKKFTLTPAKAALLTVNDFYIYLVDETGLEHNLTNDDTGVTVDVTGSVVTVSLEFSIFASLSISKVWEFFVTETLGKVAWFTPDDLYFKINANKTKGIFDATASRAFNTDYVNPYSYPIKVHAQSNWTGSIHLSEFHLNGVKTQQSKDYTATTDGIKVPPGATYRIKAGINTINGTTPSVYYWGEEPC